jgi:glycosyltransferase involved in cell wall biosynthesis
MSKLSKSLFTIIIPIHNGDSTIEKTLNSIVNQKNLNLVKTIILINDGSTDKSQQKIDEFKKTNKINIKIIKHLKSQGLASSFNQAIKMATTDYLILCHQDIIIKTESVFLKLKKLTTKNPETFYFFPTVLHPKYIWDKYNFWQKTLFSRYVNTKHHVPIEKFDCINRQKLIRLNLFDQKHFRTAGEDIDLMVRAQKQKYQYQDSHIKVIHLHNKNPNFSFKDLVRKEKQLAQTKGVLLRIHGLVIPNLRSFFREIIFISLLIPQINIFGLILLFIYTFGYNWRMYQLINRDSKVLLLPFINLYLFFINITASTEAFLIKKQTI